MAFPFGESSPKKDFSKVSMDIVTTSTFLETKRLIDYLEDEEGCINIFDLVPVTGKTCFFKVSLFNTNNKHFCRVGLHVMAAQSYHGARVFNDVDAFIAYRRNLSLS